MNSENNNPSNPLSLGDENEMNENSQNKDATPQFKSRIDLSKLMEATLQMKSEISKIVIGQERIMDLLLIAILSDGHVLIEGVPGVAKTLMAKLISRTISVNFSRIQFTPDLMPSDILGTSIYNLKTTEFEYKKGPIFSNIILIDEINRAPAKTQAALFEVMEERQVTVDGTTYPMDIPMIVMATQNPVEQEGTYRLPEAQLDRFMFKIKVGYPTEQQECKIILDYHKAHDVVDINTVKPVINSKQLEEFRAQVAQVHIEEKLVNYIAALVTRTRNNNELFLGASPRASLAILSGAKVTAAINGRDFIIPDDIKFVAIPVLSHRILLTPEKEMEGVTTDDVVKQIIQQIEVPR